MANELTSAALDAMASRCAVKHVHREGLWSYRVLLTEAERDALVARVREAERERDAARAVVEGIRAWCNEPICTENELGLALCAMGMVPEHAEIAAAAGYKAILDARREVADLLSAVAKQE